MLQQAYELKNLSYPYRKTQQHDQSHYVNSHYYQHDRLHVNVFPATACSLSRATTSVSVRG